MACAHVRLESVGEQKTDDGVNSYYRCSRCGALMVKLPSQKVVEIPGVQPGRP